MISEEKARLASAKSILRIIGVGILLAAVQIIHAQGILGTNLIVNGNAEAGAAGSATTLVASIPGWTRTGNANVVPYGLTGYVLLTSPAPPDHSFQYFAGGSGNSMLTQTIDVSSGASIIGGGAVKFTASAFLGRFSGINGLAAEMVVAFQNSTGQTFSTATVGPSTFPQIGMALEQQIGLVPAGTTRIMVTLNLNAVSGGAPAADSLSLVLSTLSTTPGSVLGTNLVVNGGGESGPNASFPNTALYVPGWSTANSNSGALTVTPYGGTGWITTSDPGPPDRGVNLFYAPGGSKMFQDIDVSPASSLIDSGQVTYQVSAWLGGLTGVSPISTYMFFDWSGNQLAPTGQLGPASHSGPGLVETSSSGSLPAGTRRVHIILSDTDAGTPLADNISFTLIAPGAPPVITPGGVVSASAFGGFTAVAPGSWIEIYGSNLASTTGSWTNADFTNGVAPTALSGTSVSVGGASAFIDYVSPGQIDALVPSTAPTGAQELRVTNANGTSDGFGITVNQTEPGLLAPPSFTIGGKPYIAAILSDNQSFALPVGAISGVASRPANVGEVLTIYGVGFGPVTGGFTAGTLVTQQNQLTSPIQFLFGSTVATVSYYGLAPSFTGLYQFDVVVPNVNANNAEPISMTLGGVKGPQTLYIAVN